MAETRDPRSALIDAMAPEEKILALEYFQGSDPERFDEAAREARIRYERAGGYRADRPTPETRDDLRKQYAEALLPLLPGDLYGSPAGGVAGRLADAVLAVRDDELERLRHLLAVQQDQNAPLTVAAWRGYATHWRDRAEEAEAKLDGLDNLHQPRQITEIRPCEAHLPLTRANAVASHVCPDCERSPAVYCSDIRCCGWPCEPHLILHDETAETCAHRAGETAAPKRGNTDADR